MIINWFKNLFVKEEDKELLREINSIEVSYEAIESYRKCVKSNWHESCDMCKKKLLRNWLVGKVEYKKGDKETRSYGNLAINKRGNVITSIYNRRGVYPFEIDINNKLKIEKMLGL